MRVPISGITVGFRIIKGSTKDSSDFAKLFVVQVADKDHDADLITIYVQNTDLIQQLIMDYSSGELRWIDTFCHQLQDGREKIWLLEKIFFLSNKPIPVT